MAKKQSKFVERCPVYRKSFESIKLCVVSVVKKDNSVQTIHTNPSFMMLDKNEKVETKVALLAEAVSGLTGYQSYSYQIT